MAASFGLNMRGGEWQALQEGDQAPLSARVAVDVALSRLDGSVSGKQLYITQAAARAVDVARGAGDEGAPARVRRAAFKAEVGKKRGEPIDDACRPQMAPAGRANDWSRRFASTQPGCGAHSLFKSVRARSGLSPAITRGPTRA